MRGHERVVQHQFQRYGRLFHPLPPGPPQHRCLLLLRLPHAARPPLPALLQHQVNSDKLETTWTILRPFGRTMFGKRW